MQPVCLQLESPLSTLGTVHQRQARLLPPHEPNVVAAVVRAPVLRALVSPNMPLTGKFLFPVLFQHFDPLFSPAATHWRLPLLGYNTPPPSLTSMSLKASSLRQPAPTRRSRWTHREERSWTKRTWIGTGWTGFTPFPVPWSCSASSTSTRPSAALSWWWWPCWCFTCERTFPFTPDCRSANPVCCSTNKMQLTAAVKDLQWEKCDVCRHQAGWFPFNLENELRLPGDPANPEDMEEEPQNQDLQEMVATPHLCSFALAAKTTKLHIQIKHLEILACKWICKSDRVKVATIQRWLSFWSLIQHVQC